MMIWLPVILLAYFFFSWSSFGDKLVLSRHLKPATYLFYVGFFSLLVLPLIFFTDFHIPAANVLFLVFLASASFMAGLFFLYSAVEKFEVSRVTPIVGSFQPLAVLFLSWIFWQSQTLKTSHVIAFFILLVATFVISWEKKISLTKNLVIFSLAASLLMALNIVLMKMVFSHLSFLHSLVWVGISNFLVAILFNLKSNLVRDLFGGKKHSTIKSNIMLVLATQSAGGVAGLLQSAAIFLAPASSLAIINSLRGVQYVFLFLITLFFSFFSPGVLKEDFSKSVIFQKLFAIILVFISLFLLFL